MHRRLSIAATAVGILAGLLAVVTVATPAQAADRSDAIHNYLSDKCLDARDNSAGTPNQNGDIVQIWACTGGSMQGWLPVEVGQTGWFRLENDFASPRKCLDAADDVNGHPDQDGDKIQVWSCNGNAQQLWAVGAASPGVLVNKYAGLCLDARSDAPYSPKNNGDKVQLWHCNYQQQQYWY